MRESKKREQYWNGFRDALVRGVRDPSKPEWQNDSARVAYQRGFCDGERAATRLGGVQPTSFPLPETPEEVHEIKRRIALLEAHDKTRRETQEEEAP